VAPVRIDSPKQGERVRDIVTITGLADSPDFVAYRLEFGAGNPPVAWNLIGRFEKKQTGGGLGLWNTAGLAEGKYTLRLVLEDAQRGELSTFITVTIGKGGTTVKPTATPKPRR
jgi:hypothetical protein